MIKKHYIVSSLFLVTALILVGHYFAVKDLGRHFDFSRIYNYSLSMTFDNDVDGVNVTTYLPISNDRQTVLNETIHSGQLSYENLSGYNSRQIRWSGEQTDRIHYEATVKSSAVNFSIDPSILIDPDPPAEFAKYLTSTPAMPKDAPEILDLWSEIKPQSSRLAMPVVEAIYNYVYHEIDGAAFKGFTSALTALRLKQASCNGKSRLMVSLARANGIPARLIGGVVMNTGSKKTSHQWVEFLIAGQWVPFDATNGHFAHLPANYLQLYVGDEVLFKYTANINFDYRFTISSALRPNYLLAQDNSYQMNAAVIMSNSGMSEQAAHIFLLFPLCTLLIAFLRNIVGLHTLGVFVPMLIAAACVFNGLWTGLAVFAGIMFVAFAAHWFLERYKMLKIPRLAAIITFCTMAIIGINLLAPQKSTLELGMLSLFPIVIVSFLAERIHDLASEQDWKQISAVAFGTTLSTVLCYYIFESIILQALFAVLPELLFTVVGLQILVGRWPGLRLSEYFRFSSIVADGETMGINHRNIDYVNTKNTRELLSLAVDKLQSKAALVDYAIPVPGTIAICKNLSGLDEFMAALDKLESVAIKPNKGSKGFGIVILTDKKGSDFYSPSGTVWTKADLRRHITEIVNGAFSQNSSPDVAYLEPLLRQHSSIDNLFDNGLADIRIILDEGKPISAMLRLPTQGSDGKANLHQGAVGLSIDLASGKVTHAALKGKKVTHHPDSGRALIGYQLPYWHRIVEIAVNCYDAIELGYMGVDICIDQDNGPMVLEVNGRPGLEIQNVQNKGMRNAFTPALA